MILFDHTFFGKPSAQKRARATGRGGFIRMYDPSKPEKVDVIRELRSIGKIPKIDFPFVLSMQIFLPFPKSTPKKKLIEFTPCPTKPDIDNYLKFYLDCLKDAEVITDDRFCFYLKDSFKVYSTKTEGSVRLVLETI